MSYLSEVLLDAPVHYWRGLTGPGPLQFDIGSAPAALSGASGFVLGPFSGPASDGGSFYLDGSASGFIGTPDSRVWIPLPGTLEFWFWQVQQTTSATGYIWSSSAFTGTNYFNVSSASGFYGFSVGGFFNNSVLAYGINAWHHIVIALSARSGTTANVDLYIDSFPIVSNQVVTINTQVGLMEFGRNVSNTLPTAVVMAELAIYNTRLSGARVSAHYLAADSRTGAMRGLVNPAAVGGASTPGVGGVDLVSLTDVSSILAAVQKTFPTT